MTRGQRRLVLILAALAVCGGVYGLWWERAAQSAKTLLVRWIDERREAGFTITHDGIETAGFPLRIELEVASPKVSRGGEGGFSWQGPQRMTAGIHPLSPSQIRISAPGPQLLEAGGIAYAMSSGVFDAVFEARGRELLALTLAVEAAAIESPAWGGPLTLGRLSLDLARREGVPPEDLSTPTGALVIDLADATLPEGRLSPLGPRLAALRLGLTVKGPLPASLSGADLSAWTEAGGIVDLKGFHLDYQPLLLNGDGTLALDRQLQPMASLVLKTKGAFETIDALAAKGLIPADTAMPLKLAMAVLAKSPPDQETGALSVPMTLQGRDLFLGPAPIARLPPMPWE